MTNVSLLHADALTALGHGDALHRRLRAGESGLISAEHVFGPHPKYPRCGMVGTITGVTGEVRAPQLLHMAFDRIVPPCFGQVDLIIGACSLGDLAGPDAGNPQRAMNRALAHHWMGPGAVPPTSMVSSACSSGTDAVIVACQALQAGIADVVGVVAYDTLSPGKLMQHLALGTQSPDRARPFDVSRSGTSFGEACAVVILANERGTARWPTAPLARIAGHGMTSDAHDITAPHPGGTHAASAIRLALGEHPLHHVGYINAHGSGTRLSDTAESHAFRAVFGDLTSQASIGGTKGALGHTLGATGLVELVVTLNALKQGIYPPTAGLLDIDRHLGLSILQQATARRPEHRFGMSTTFGFGGVNSALLLEVPC